MTPGLPLGPHPSNVFAFAPGLPSFWPATLQPLALVASPKLGLRQSACRKASGLLVQLVVSLKSAVGSMSKLNQFYFERCRRLFQKFSLIKLFVRELL
jgi:hypothetical protein